MAHKHNAFLQISLNMGKGIAILLVCMSLSCQNPSATSVAPQTPQKPDLSKDLRTYILPKVVTDTSPVAQEHFNQFLPYNTVRHKLKPRSILMDRAETIVAPISALVTRLNFLHVAYDREGTRVWNGSLIYGDNENPLVATSEGFHLGVKYTSEGLEFSFQDGDMVVKELLSAQEDSWNIWKESDRQLSVYNYIFPKEL